MEKTIEKEAMFRLTYGLFVLTAREGEKDNGCIVNTVSMLTDNPKRITVYVNKANYTEGMIRRTGKLAVSVLTESAPFSLFTRFGFSSGKNADKFVGFPCPRNAEGLYYLAEHTNAFISADVVGVHDYGTHTLFVAEVTEAKTLSEEPSLSYDYYFAHIKPSPAVSSAFGAPTADGTKADKTSAAENGGTEKKLHRWVCKICGYVYEGETLPADYICPLCKHGADDFEQID